MLYYRKGYRCLCIPGTIIRGYSLICLGHGPMKMMETLFFCILHSFMDVFTKTNRPSGAAITVCHKTVVHSQFTTRGHPLESGKVGPSTPPPQRCHCRHVQSLTAPAWRGISILPLKCRLVPPPPWKVDQLLLSANPCFTNCCPRADTILVFLGGGWRLISFSFPFLHSSMHCYTNRDTDPYL